MGQRHPFTIQSLLVLPVLLLSCRIGQCGVSPQQIAGLPTRICGRVPGDAADPSQAPTDSTSPPSGNDGNNTPNPQLGKMPVVPVKAGESANWGVGRVGAYDRSAKTAVDITAAVQASGYKVAILDTGVDAGHPDLHVVEFMDIADTPAGQYYKKDGE